MKDHNMCMHIYINMYVQLLQQMEHIFFKILVPPLPQTTVQGTKLVEANVNFLKKGEKITLNAT